MKKVYLSLAFIVFFIIGFFAAENLNKEIYTVIRSKFLLGTIVEIQIRDSDNQKADEVISDAFNEVQRIDKLFSIYDSESPVCKINSSGDSIINVDEEIFGLIQKCDSFWQLSSGSFDISIGSVISTWGFGKGNPAIPSHEEITKALKNSGWKDVGFPDKNKLKKHDGVKFDFGAVVAGYAADKAIEVIAKSGITNALVNTGGEIRGIGDDWTIGIQHPRIGGQILEKLKLHGKAIATSGDYEQYFEENGRRYHHIINPKDGLPAPECQSVTVIADNGLTADALATGIFVLGPAKGLELAESLENVEAYIVDNSGQILQSSGFKNFISR
ncbi:MAG TPA: FAD:protein FMN transferase [Ignavibacteriaceae bacterium]|nr:FAD:protein FMN transferase [Ignavibacteriaceae bacterium]